MALNKEQLLTIKARGLPCKEIDVPELGGTVYIARLTGRERDELEWAVEENKARKADIRALYAAACLCDENRNRFFTFEDVDIVAALDGIALDRIYVAALRFNRMRRKDIDELEKNSEATASDSTPSA